MKKYLVTVLVGILSFGPINSLSGKQKDQSKADSRPKPTLSDKEDPEKIGKRNINKHQIDFYSLEKEVALGRQLAQQIDQTAKFIDDPIIAEYINRLGQNIVLHSDAKIPFTIKVIVSDEINAFALPGGFFYVNVGLIIAADNEAELAGVMAHEIAHVAARHAMENLTKGQLVNIALIPLIFVSGGLGSLIQIALGTGIQMGLPLAFLKFNRGAESEADMLGAQYSWATGYDPDKLITFFDKLQAKDKKEPGTIAKVFMTHPPPHDRQISIKKLVQRFPDKEEYIVNSSEFINIKDRLARYFSVSKVSPSGNNQESKRPTLRRKGPDAPIPPDQTDQKKPDSDSEKDKKEPPALKRKPN